ncbi:MAG: archaeal proteasome endopeptidase complex subunit alpha [Candidatus Methanoperedens sp.]|nr:archaeal proteasome endopeptidase complex subunit alpha [Candidatus Methanoperedens sp.]
MMQSPQTGYDSAITVFSPDGRLFQVEYAREAVKRGTTALGIKAKDGAVLIVDKRSGSRLVEMESIEKIFQIDEHIGVATSGLVADARALVDFARVQAQVNKTTYDELIGIETLSKEICDFKHAYTQSGGARPFGVSLLIAGIEGNVMRLFETDPSGALLEYKATGIGAGRPQIMEFLEKNYTEDITLESAIILGLEALNSMTETKLSESTIEIGVIELSTGKFRKLIPGEVKESLSKITTEKHDKGTKAKKK